MKRAPPCPPGLAKQSMATSPVFDFNKQRRQPRVQQVSTFIQEPPISSEEDTQHHPASPAPRDISKFYGNFLTSQKTYVGKTSPKSTTVKSAEGAAIPDNNVQEETITWEAFQAEKARQENERRLLESAAIERENELLILGDPQELSPITTPLSEESNLLDLYPTITPTSVAAPAPAVTASTTDTTTTTTTTAIIKPLVPVVPRAKEHNTDISGDIIGGLVLQGIRDAPGNIKRKSKGTGLQQKDTVGVEAKQEAVIKVESNLSADDLIEL